MFGKSQLETRPTIVSDKEPGELTVHSFLPAFSNYPQEKIIILLGLKILMVSKSSIVLLKPYF
jgi:hypothetical protein